MEGHGGYLASEVLRAHGVDTVYTLSGGHIFPFYDGCVRSGIRLIDVRHEQSATFAAEAHAKLTRGPGVSIVTAGPGVTNSVSAITTAYMNGAPAIVLGGRAGQRGWGRGSLQELDHIPIVSSITKDAWTVTDPGACATDLDRGIRTALTPHRGPVFLDYPIDVVFRPGEAEIPGPIERPVGAEPDPADVGRVAELLAAAERPVIVAGTDIWFEEAWEPLRHLAETARVPVVLNGMGRGCIPADHELAFARARSAAFKEADLVIVVGTPLDFRVGFGRFGEAGVVHVQDAPEKLSRHAELAASLAGALRPSLDGIREGVEAAQRRPDREPWITRLRDEERARREAERDELESDAYPIHPARIYGALRRKLDRDAIIIGDGGDFVSYAGKLIDSYVPGAWLDPGPYGCLGTGVGYAMAARAVHPDRQVVLLLGDGAMGFAGLELDTLVRHGLPVVGIVGNNGIWGLEKHPMRNIYGYDVAADLSQDTRYDEVMRAVGGGGETVEKASELDGALDRAFKADGPYLLNVLTDPAVAYPRSSSLG